MADLMFILMCTSLALIFLVLRRTLGGAPTIYKPFLGTIAHDWFWEWDNTEWKPRRTPTLMLMALFGSVPFLVYGPWWSGFIGAVITVIFWNGAPFLPDHRFHGPGWQIANIVRYGPCSLGWLLADWFWPTNWKIGEFINGHTTAGEAGAGLIYGPCLTAVAYYAGPYLLSIL